MATDSKQKQKRLKRIICSLLFVSILALSIIGFAVHRELRPQNIMVPLDHESIEMKTAKMLSGPDGAHIYRFTTTDEYKRLYLHVSEYHSGKLINKEHLVIGFEGIGSPEEGDIIIGPDFESFVVRTVISAGGSKLSTEIPVLEAVAGREYYGRSATEIRESIPVRYNEEQALLALIYDNDEMRVLDIEHLMGGETQSLKENDYVYFFSFEFCKE